MLTFLYFLFFFCFFTLMECYLLPTPCQANIWKLFSCFLVVIDRIYFVIKYYVVTSIKSDITR